MQITVNATMMMDYTSIDEMAACTVAGAGAQLHKRANNIRLTRLRCHQQQRHISASKTRLVLLLLGLWMNLIAVTNGKCLLVVHCTFHIGYTIVKSEKKKAN